MDIAQGGPAQANGRGHIQKAAFHQDHIRRVNGHIRTGTDGDARIRPGQGRGIVDAVTHHGYLALGSQRTDHRLLALRQDPGNDLIHTGLGADGLGSALVVAGEHHHPDAHIPQLGDGLGAVLLDGVRHTDHADKPAVQCKEQGGLSLLGKLRRPGLRFLGNFRLGFYKGQTAAHQLLSVQKCFQAVTGQGRKIRNGLGLKPPAAALLQNGLCQGMLAFAFQGQGQLQKVVLLKSRLRDQVCDLGGSCGDGSGFVQHHDLGLSGLLQGDGILKEDAVLGPYPVSHHNGHRRGKAQGAGTADDQNGNAPGQGKGKVPAQKQPHQGGHNGDADHPRNKHPGDPVRDFGNGSLGGGGIGDHFDDLRQGGILPHPAGFTAQEAGLVDGGGGNGAARGLVHGDALPGQGCLIHRAGAFQHHAVHRNALPRPDHEYITLADLPDGHRHFLPLAEEGGGLGCQLHQGFQGIRGLALGPGLQHFAHGDEGQDHSGGLKIEFVHIGHDPGHIPPKLGIGHGKQGVDAP